MSQIPLGADAKDEDQCVDGAKAQGPRRGVWRSLPRAFLGSLVLVLAIEALVDRHAIDFATPERWAWRESGRLARRVGPRGEILCFGDSEMKLGIAATPIEERTGRRTFNLAIPGGHAPSSYYLLRRALEAGARPSAVVVDFEMKFLTLSPRVNSHEWSALLDTRDSLDLAWTARDAGLLATITLDRLIPTVRYRSSIRNSIRAALRGRGESTSRRADIAMLLSNWRMNRGAQILPRQPAFQRPRIEIDRELLAADPWSCSPVYETFLHRFFKLAASEGIAVVWLLPPVVPEIQAQRDESGLSAKFTRFVRRFAAEYRNVTVFDSRSCGYPHTVFYDPIHPDRQGAFLLSGALADQLGPLLAGTALARWVELPPYLEQPADTRLRDIFQTDPRLTRLDSQGVQR
jgi:hypothetical protein